MSKGTIGFFGDSFCSKSDSGTYIDIITKELDLEIVHLGVAGSSADDLILEQFHSGNWGQDSVPDICVFCWTDLHRLYNKQVRNINGGSLSNIDKENLPREKFEILQAAQNYYKNLYDHDWHKLRHNSMIYYFNYHLLTKHSDKKFINLWSFPPELKSFTDNNKKDFATDNEVYAFRFANGVEIRPSLISLSTTDQDCPPTLLGDLRPNHLGSEKSNRILASAILDAIQNYESGKLITIDMDKIK